MLGRVSADCRCVASFCLLSIELLRRAGHYCVESDSVCLCRWTRSDRAAFGTVQLVDASEPNLTDPVDLRLCADYLAATDMSVAQEVVACFVSLTPRACFGRVDPGQHSKAVDLHIDAPIESGCLLQVSPNDFRCHWMSVLSQELEYATPHLLSYIG